MEDKLKKLKGITTQIAATAAIATTRIIIYLVVGAIINIALLFVLWGEICRIWATSGGSIISSLIILAVIAASPFVYFFLGQKQSYEYAAYRIVSKNADQFFYFLLTKISEKKEGVIRKIYENGTGVDSQIENLLHDKKGFPKIVRFTIGFMLRRFDFVDRLSDAGSNIDITTMDDEQINAVTAENLCEAFDIEQLKPGWLLPSVIIAANIGIPVFIRYVI
ncbi:MAG: hypothetical protein D6B27_06255 [Gammaproteobacteria bacterium]|mgnify:FL=1|nr:MAG: hypothetical protein D6B27_06255 [Gammaproteobacteria bacterium]